MPWLLWLEKYYLKTNYSTARKGYGLNPIQQMLPLDIQPLQTCGLYLYGSINLNKMTGKMNNFIKCHCCS